MGIWESSQIALFREGKRKMHACNGHAQFCYAQITFLTLGDIKNLHEGLTMDAIGEVLAACEPSKYGIEAANTRITPQAPFLQDAFNKIISFGLCKPSERPSFRSEWLKISACHGLDGS